MISVKQFLQDIQEATYPNDTNAQVLDGMSPKEKMKAAQTCLHFLTKEEGSFKEKDGFLYLSTPIQSIFEDAIKFMLDENEYYSQMELPECLYPISIEGRSWVKGKYDPTILSLLCAFDKWFGYDTACAYGIIGLTFADIEKQHALYQKVFGGESLHEQLLKLFGKNYDRFIKVAKSPKLFGKELEIVQNKCSKFQSELNQLKKIKQKKDDKKKMEERQVKVKNELSVLQSMIDGNIAVDRDAVESYYLHASDFDVRQLARQLASTFSWTFKDD